MNGPAAQALYESAKALHAQGRLPEAERLYRRLLELAPSHPGVLQRLAEISFRDGRVAEAAEFLRQALTSAPGDAKMLANCGFMLEQLGRNDEAVTCLEQAVSVSPNSPQILTNLGNALAALGRREEALVRYQQASEIEPGLAEPHNNIGNVLKALGRREEAAAAYRRALDIRPDFAEAWSNLGTVLLGQGRHDEAFACFDRAIALDPHSAAAHNNMGTALAAAGQHENAVGAYRRAIELRPAHGRTWTNLGCSLNALGSPEDAAVAFQRAQAIEPGSALAYAGLGSALFSLGRFDEARAACEKAVTLAPELPAVHHALSEVKRYVSGDPQIAWMEKLADRAAEMEDGEQADLFFALGKAHADCGEHARAFASFARGNVAKRRLTAYDEAAHLGEMRATAALFSAALIAARRGGGDPSDRPIFIIGMPRSGTSLVEQILASHPHVFGTGERLEFGREVVGTYKPGPLPFDAVSISATDFTRLGRNYLNAMAGKVPRDALRFTDKMPANFRFAGLIHLTLPNARIIHVQRNPLDTCVSCFTKLFTGSLDFTYDLAELGRYYAAYERLMDHWRSVLPPAVMLDVRYEELVEDFEAQARRIVGHCGLPWNDRCLEFHTTDRAVMTASAAQVRQPLFKTSVGRWRAYEPWLEPLRRALEERKR